jgi:hypothetical protein
MPNRAVRLVLGPQNAPTILAAGTPSVFWALMGVAVLRMAYGLDALLEGSPTMLLAGGVGFSRLYSSLFLAAAVWAFVGTLLTITTGRARQEGTLTLVAALVWNAVHGLGPFTGVWQTLALAWVAGWRLLNIGGSYVPTKPGPQPLLLPRRR